MLSRKNRESVIRALCIFEAYVNQNGISSNSYNIQDKLERALLQFRNDLLMECSVSYYDKEWCVESEFATRRYTSDSPLGGSPSADNIVNRYYEKGFEVHYFSDWSNDEKPFEWRVSKRMTMKNADVETLTAAIDSVTEACFDILRKSETYDGCEEDKSYVKHIFRNYGINESLYREIEVYHSDNNQITKSLFETDNKDSRIIVHDRKNGTELDVFFASPIPTKYEFNKNGDEYAVHFNDHEGIIREIPSTTKAWKYKGKGKERKTGIAAIRDFDNRIKFFFDDYHEFFKIAEVILPLHDSNEKTDTNTDSSLRQILLIDERYIDYVDIISAVYCKVFS